MLNDKISLKSLYPFSYKECNKIKKTFISLRLLLFKNKIYKKHVKNNYASEIAFLEGPITSLFSIKNNNTKKIAWIHNDISKVFGETIKGKIKKKINKRIYLKYDKLVFVSNDNLEKFNEIYPINIEKKVIYNYLNIENIIEKSNENIGNIFDESCTNFVTVCRLAEQKAIDRLITVHFKLLKNGYFHKFYVIGDGPLKNKLQELIKKLKIEETFILLGAKQNPYPYIKAADYFCLFSYYEGYPMALLEAKALNKYILITDTAARETLQDYPYKQIFENSENGIYEGLRDFLTNKTNEEIKYKYENKKILNQITAMIEE